MASASCSRRARIDLAAVSLALGGTLMVLSFGPDVAERTVMELGSSASTSDGLDACTRGYSSIDSNAGVDGLVDPDPRFLERACVLAGGSACDFSHVIPRETALCVAEQSVLGEGEAGRASLAYDAARAVPVWRVVGAAVSAEGVRACETLVVTVHARTGELLTWESARDPFCGG